MPTRTESAVIAVFSNCSAAQAAAAELVSNAFAGDHIHIVSEATAIPRHDAPVQRAGAGHEEKSVANWLESVFASPTESERRQYEEAVRAGKILLGVNTPDQMADKAAEILTHHSPASLHRENASESSSRTHPYAAGYRRN